MFGRYAILVYALITKWLQAWASSVDLAAFQSLCINGLFSRTDTALYNHLVRL